MSSPPLGASPPSAPWGDDAVQTGFWTNWSKGAVLGTFLTLRSEHAIMVLAALILFIAIVAERFWRITCFLIHQLLAGRGQQDGLYHQQQATLRNADSPYAAIRTFVQIAWAWRIAADRTLLRQLPLILLGAVEILGFLLAGILSTYLVTFGDEALITGRSCGFPARGGAQASVEMQAVVAADQRAAALARSGLVRDCYADGASAQSPACVQYVVPKIASEVRTGVDCPFAEPGICADGADVVQIVSEMIDSNGHLGINNPPEERIQYRRALTCAPIQDTRESGYAQTRRGNASEFEDPSLTYVDFLYSTTNDNTQEVTFSAPIASEAMRRSSPGYILRTAQDMMNSTRDGSAVSAFSARPELFPWFSDVHLFLLTKSVAYTAPTNSSWFGPVARSSESLWLPQRPSVMACAEQHEFCNGASGRCTEWGGIDGLGKLTALTPEPPSASLKENITDPTAYVLETDLGTSKLQNATLTLLRGAIDQNSLSTLLPALGSDALLASQSVLPSSLSPPPPEDQMTAEVKRWNDMILAGLQQSLLSRVRDASTLPSSGTTTEDANAPSLTFGSSGQTAPLCAQQKARAAGFASISVLGASILLGVGFLIVLTSWVLPSLVWALGTRLLRRSAAPRREWRETAVLQLQRAAYEGAGIGSWVCRRGAHRGVPVTARREWFGLPSESSDMRQDINLHDPAYVQRVVNGSGHQDGGWLMGRTGSGKWGIVKRAEDGSDDGETPRWALGRKATADWQMPPQHPPPTHHPDAARGMAGPDGVDLGIGMAISPDPALGISQPSTTTTANPHPGGWHSSGSSGSSADLIRRMSSATRHPPPPQQTANGDRMRHLSTGGVFHASAAPAPLRPRIEPGRALHRQQQSDANDISANITPVEPPSYYFSAAAAAAQPLGLGASPVVPDGGDWQKPRVPSKAEGLGVSNGGFGGGGVGADDFLVSPLDTAFLHAAGKLSEDGSYASGDVSPSEYDDDEEDGGRPPQRTTWI